MSIVRNTAYNLASALVPIAVSLLTVPPYIRALGEERYGVLALIAMLLGYFGVFDFGLSTATAQRIAAHGHDLAARRRTFWTATFANLALGMAGALLILPVAWYFAGHGMKAPPAMLPEARQAMVWLVLALPVMLLTGVLRGALQGAGRFAELNLVNIVTSPISQLVPLAVALWYSPSLTAVLPALYLTRLLALGWYLLEVVRKVTSGWSPSYDRREARHLIAFGGWMTLSGLIGPVIVGMDRILIGWLIGVRQVSHYAVPYQLAERGSFVPMALVQAMFPRISASASRQEAIRLSERGLAALAAICAPPMVAGVVFMQPFLAWWVGRDFAASAAPIGQVILAGFWLNALGIGCANHLMAQGRPKALGLVHAIEVLPYCLLLYVCMRGMGLTGAALAFALRVAVDDLLLAGLAGLLRRTSMLMLAGIPAFAIATWIGWGLELADIGHVALGLLLIAAVGGVSLVWLAGEKEALQAALRRKTG